jgi:hypothetical protein
MFRGFVLFVALLVGGSGCHTDEGSNADMAQPGEIDMAQPSTSPDLATPSTPNAGNITVFSYSYATQSGTNAGYDAGASFIVGNTPTPAGCTPSLIGPCTTLSCVVEAADGGTTGAVTLASGGNVMIDGGATALTLAPMANGFYPPLSSTTQALFSGGETLHFTNTGSLAPATTIALTAPTQPTITMPTPASTYTISRAADFPIAWTGGNGGTVDVSIMTNVSSTAPGTPYGSISCSFPVATGSGAIPAAALAVLPTGSSTLRVGVAVRATSIVGSWGITAVAGTYMLASSGSPFAGGQANIN